MKFKLVWPDGTTAKLTGVIAFQDDEKKIVACKEMLYSPDIRILEDKE